MNQHIKGKRYNTNAAVCIASWMLKGVEPGADSMLERLYRKSTGEYFLYGSGGSATKYAQHTSEGFPAPGEKIIPLSPEAARKWGKEHVPEEDFQKTFYGDRDVFVGFRIPEADAAKLKEYAKSKFSTQQAVLREIIANL